MSEFPFLHESLLQEKSGNKVRCNVCERRCLLVDGGRGWCQTRQNLDGSLVTLIFGAVSSMAANPVEKKPFYHFWPGTRAFTAGSWSCNFGCPWCQNWDISKQPPPVRGRFVSPAEFVARAEGTACSGTSISFNEPTLSLEWSIEVFRLARAHGLYNTFVTNGYMTPEALTVLFDGGLDAMNVDIKGSADAVRKYCKAIDVEKVWTACKLARTNGVHIEITTLLIPTVNDSDTDLNTIARRIVTDLGPSTPWHVSAYTPAYRFEVHPTPVRTLERAWRIGRNVGLEFVYAGNVPGHPYDNTYCPQCDKLLIQRMGFQVLTNEIHRGRCPQCDTPIAGIWNEGATGKQSSRWVG